IAQSFACSERPIVCKRFLEAPYDGAFEAEMQIPDGTPGLVAENVAMANVHSSGEGSLSINHEDLAVVAQIYCCHAPRRERGCRQEFRKRNLRLAQSVGDGRP